MHTPRIICILDGMADLPARDGQPTPLAAAHTPTLDHLAATGTAGLCQVIPCGAEAGSDAGIPALLGYDPLRHPAARGPLEALAAGLTLAPRDTAWRCNVVALDAHGTIADPAATLLPATEQTIARIVSEAFPPPSHATAHGGGFRFTVVERDTASHAASPSSPVISSSPTPAFTAPTPFTPAGPQDVVGQSPADALSNLAHHHPALHARITAANAHLARYTEKDAPHGLALWPWGCGHRPDLPPFATRRTSTATASTPGAPLAAAMVAAVPLARGLALAAGLAAPEIPGATGGADTDLAAKAAAALALLADHAVVFIHVEGPDMCAHARDARAKSALLARIDVELIAPLRTARPDALLCVTCDHITHCGDGRHHPDAVPFLLHGPGTLPHPAARFDEAACAATGLRIPSGPALLDLILRAETNRAGA
ncbi:phosphoglycerate mutase [Nitratidesulfovibrio sp. SRB-5]|uniref:phosphoglycerate mutase n=1 Tax=Nitratidesulfovibrio sp. SRB-5 TaxID=2872636 RepID=UPI0010266D9F|nr:phosphoglycerate mutase [Nitratidesulfovibrio sp. SRB-5]MBZ2172431.1 phosphoglycerate mutase [Nitratidesulfovibrio sp. SRB-5]RXF76596.1 phosphoglycerate mutase [Desulfovibrio sp. DS-1]